MSLSYLQVLQEQQEDNQVHESESFFSYGNLNTERTLNIKEFDKVPF